MPVRWPSGGVVGTGNDQIADVPEAIDFVTFTPIINPPAGSVRVYYDGVDLKFIDSSGTPFTLGGSGAAETLAATLSAGSITGGSNIGVSAGDRILAATATPIGIQVNSNAVTVGTSGSLVAPINAASFTDGVGGDADGAIGVNTSTNQIEFRSSGAWQTVSVATDSLATTLGAGNSTGGTNLQITSGDEIEMPVTATPSITVTGDLNTGIGSPSADILTLHVGGSQLQVTDVPIDPAVTPGLSYTANNFSNGMRVGFDQVLGGLISRMIAQPRAGNAFASFFFLPSGTQQRAFFQMRNGSDLVNSGAVLMDIGAGAVDNFDLHSQTFGTGTSITRFRFGETFASPGTLTNFDFMVADAVVSTIEGDGAMVLGGAATAGSEFLRVVGDARVEGDVLLPAAGNQVVFTRGQTITFDSLTQTVGAGIAQVPDLAGTTDQFVMEDVSQTLTNKTLTTPLITTGGSIDVTAAGTLSIGGSMGANTLTLGGATSNVLAAGSLEIDGDINHDGANIGFNSATPVAQMTSGADLTNNVTVGGTSDVIDDWTDLTTYATDAAAIRNAVHQLARKLKQINDGLRLRGDFT